MDSKHIPTEYMTASREQRMELLRGLLDSDGTISAKDGRVKFVQDAARTDLNLQVYRLVASLGFQPRMKTYGKVTEVGFKPDGEPVFRLERKAAKQFSRAAHRRTDFVTFKSVEPAGRGMVRCVSVREDDREFLIGDGLVRTRNAKSTTITQAYSMWRILKDPNEKIIIVSKKQGMAADFLYSIKTMMTSPVYKTLQVKWGPVEGWKEVAAEWAATRIRITDDERDLEKDPTVQALGIGGQIYGARASLIIVDDATDVASGSQFESQGRWLLQDVVSRLYSEESKLLVVGTRVAPIDLYSHLMDEKTYDGNPSPFTYLTQPALLEEHDDPKDWVTLWPRSNKPPVGYRGEPDEDGLYPKWDGPRLQKAKRTTDSNRWLLVYQQQQTRDSTTFSTEAVQGCIDRTRNAGLLVGGRPGHPKQGMTGLYVVAGLDPAAVGHTAAVVLAVDRHTGYRWVLDVHNEPRMTPDAVRRLIKDWTERYGIREWRVEDNAFQKWLTLDREVGQWLAARGVVLSPHTTGRNKHDPDLGVASMSTLLSGWEQGYNLLRLPKPHALGVRALVEQLTTWFPETKGKTDCVMALWFADLRAREVVQSGGQSKFLDSPWLSKRQKDQRGVINVYELMGA